MTPLLLFLTPLFLLPIPGAHAADAQNQTPNIILILADDLGYGDLGCYGATKVKTPNIDRLANEGRRFLDAHSASSVCTPSRYALLTGEYPFRRNLWQPVMNPSPLVVDVSKPTLPSVLKTRGYATACFGKWHLGFGEKPNPDWNSDLKPGPLECGFDHYFGIPVVNSHPPFVWVQDHRVVGLDLDDPIQYGGKEETRLYPEKMHHPPMSGGRAAHALYNEEEHGTTLTDKAVKWMQKHADTPFFLYFATPHIHHPFTPGGKFKGSSACGVYGDFIQEFDWMVGELLRTLEELHLSDRTLVILSSDNGGMLNQGGQQAWSAGHRLNGNLLGFKFDAWEGGHRVPFIARWPGKIEPGGVSDQLICQTDLLTTLAALAGSETKGPDSINILPVLLGNPEKPIRDHLILAPNQKSHLALRNGPWIYIGAQGGGGFTGSAPGSHSLGGGGALRFTGETNSDYAEGRLRPNAPEAQLYNLAEDPTQSVNVIRENPEVARRMAAQLDQIQATPSTHNTGAPKTPRN
jgi:arylsulfatase A-like enzyme